MYLNLSKIKYSRKNYKCLMHDYVLVLLHNLLCSYTVAADILLAIWLTVNLCT